MTTVTERMEALLEEAATAGAEELDLSGFTQPLVLAMDTMGLDSQDKKDQQKFMQILKLLSGSKKAMLSSAMMKFTSSKAKSALKAAKAAV